MSEANKPNGLWMFFVPMLATIGAGEIIYWGAYWLLHRRDAIGLWEVMLVMAACLVGTFFAFFVQVKGIITLRIMEIRKTWRVGE